jgi:hypothetical protein
MKIRRHQEQGKTPIQSTNRRYTDFHPTECRGLQNILFNQRISVV